MKEKMPLSGREIQNILKLKKTIYNNPRKKNRSFKTNLWQNDLSGQQPNQKWGKPTKKEQNQRNIHILQ